MDGHLPSLEDILDWRTVLVDVFHSLVQNVVLLGATGTEGQMPVQMGSRQETHARIFGACVVNGEPDRGGFRWRQRPVTRILMPGNPLSVPRHLAKKVGPPSDKIFAQQVANAGDNFGRIQKIVNATVLQMRSTDRITVLPRSHDFGKKIIEVRANRNRLLFGKDRDRSNKALSIEIPDL